MMNIWYPTNAIKNYIIAEFESFDASKCKPSCWFKCSGVYIECTSSNVEWWDALSA
jgi:hypothetical protein